MSKGSTGIAAVLLLCVWVGCSGCSHLDAQPDGLRLLKQEVAAQQLLSKILQECAIAAGSSICRRTLPDFCTAVVMVEGSRYRCPSTML